MDHDPRLGHVTANQPCAETAVAMAANRVEVIDGTVLARLGSGPDAVTFSCRLATIITAPVGWCKPGAAAFDDPDIAALSVRLWNPVDGDKLSLLTAAGEAAQAILL